MHRGGFPPVAVVSQTGNGKGPSRRAHRDNASVGCWGSLRLSRCCPRRGLAVESAQAMWRRGLPTRRPRVPIPWQPGAGIAGTPTGMAQRPILPPAEHVPGQRVHACCMRGVPPTDMYVHRQAPAQRRQDPLEPLEPHAERAQDPVLRGRHAYGDVAVRGPSRAPAPLIGHRDV